MKKIMSIMILATMIIFSISAVSAYKLSCLTYGEAYPSGRICWHDPFCQICVTDDFKVTAPYHCSKLTACYTNNATNVDGEKPIVNIKSPKDKEYYNSRRVLLDITSNEPCLMKYLDNIDGRGRWKNVCNGCEDYQGERSFKEGLNNITFFCADRTGNTFEETRVFRVDSKPPRISKTAPKKGFASGLFDVEFKEENPVSLILHYGIYPNQRSAPLDINDCTNERDEYKCSIDVDLKDFDGEYIEYWFELEDIAGAKTESKHIQLKVDETFPVLNNVNSFWEQGEGLNSKYVYFNLNITEENFDEAYYSYLDSRGKEKEKKLCSKLDDGICKKREIFTRGPHSITLNIADEAGNTIAKPVEFNVDF